MIEGAGGVDVSTTLFYCIKKCFNRSGTEVNYHKKLSAGIGSGGSPLLLQKSKILQAKVHKLFKF